jgi:hypothetical protein
MIYGAPRQVKAPAASFALDSRFEARAAEALLQGEQTGSVLAERRIPGSISVEFCIKMQPNLDELHILF